MKEKMKIKVYTFTSRVIFPVFVFCILAAGFSGEQAQTLDKSNILNEQYRIRKCLYKFQEMGLLQYFAKGRKEFVRQIQIRK